jgi:cytoskeletal protein RodZ
VATEQIISHPEQPRFMLAAWIWATFLFISFGLIVAIVFGVMPRGSNYEETRANARSEKLKTLRDESAKTLSTYAWVDKTKGVARIPIERAMALTLTDLKTKKPTAANPIPVVEAAAAPATASPTPAAGVTPAPSPTPPKAQAVSGPNSMIGAQPAAAANPPAVPPGTQPAAAPAPNTKPAASPTGTPVLSAPGTPLPVRGKKP